MSRLSQDFPADEALSAIEPLARRWWRVWADRQRVFDLEDLRQAGYVGAILAWQSFGTHVRVPFATFAWLAVQGEMLALIATASALSGREIRRGNDFTRARLLRSDVVQPTSPKRSIDVPDVSEHLAVLKPTQREVVSLHLGIGGVTLEFHEIAARRNEPINTTMSHYYRGIKRLQKSHSLH